MAVTYYNPTYTIHFTPSLQNEVLTMKKDLPKGNARADTTTESRKYKKTLPEKKDAPVIIEKFCV